MKKFFNEFKKFITRGNVLDMAVGIIVGGAFTAIITSLVNNILTPLINWIPGADNTGALQVVLREAVLDEGGTVVTPALIMDFGAVISAIVSFLITAFVLFVIVKTVNSIHQHGEKIKEELKKKAEENKAKSEGAEENAVEDKPAAPAEPAAPAVPVETSEDVLKEIRDLLKAQSVKTSVEEVKEEKE